MAVHPTLKITTFALQCLLVLGIRVVREEQQAGEYTEDLLRRIPEVFKGTILDKLLPGSVDIPSELQYFRKHFSAFGAAKSTHLDINETEAAVAFAQVNTSTLRDPGNAVKKLGFRHGGTCDTGYVWFENSIALQSNLPGPRMSEFSGNLNFWSEYQGWKWSRWMCSYGIRINLNRYDTCKKPAKDTDAPTDWHLKGYKWTYAKPGNLCPMMQNKETLRLRQANRPYRSHLSLYFTKSCPSGDRTEGFNWQAQYASGTGIDVRPNCLAAKLKAFSTGEIVPEDMFTTAMPSGGWGVLAWGDALNTNWDYAGVIRIIYRTPWEPSFYSWACIWMGKMTSKPTAFMITVGHKHEVPVVKDSIDPSQSR